LGVRSALPGTGFALAGMMCPSFSVGDDVRIPAMTEDRKGTQRNGNAVLLCLVGVWPQELPAS
jgi:hypothetical protein